MNNQKIEKIASILLFVVGIIAVIDTLLAQFFSIGVEAKTLRLVYCIAFIFSSLKFPLIVKKKYVVIPLYIMIVQMLYSFSLRFF